MTTNQPASYSAPGSLMLLGEHAVLHGRRALVCAINKRITVKSFQCLENTLRIDSELGKYDAPLDQLTDHPQFRFVIDAVKHNPPKTGIELQIDSDFSSNIGFGSSAAVTVATHAALLHGNRKQNNSNTRRPLEKNELFTRSLATIHRVQGRGSGADVAASVYGGVVAYRANPLQIQSISETFPLTAVYSGSKMKTVDVIHHLEERRALNADYFEKIFDRMDASIGDVLENFPTLGKNLQLNQKLMEEMGLCNAALADIIKNFQALETPAKISGSGLGDCAIGLGKFPNIGTYTTYPLQVDPQGIKN